MGSKPSWGAIQQAISGVEAAGWGVPVRHYGDTPSLKCAKFGREDYRLILPSNLKYDDARDWAFVTMRMLG